VSFQLLSESNPVARKVYRCIWCGEDIIKGEKHYAYSGRYDGEFQSARTHLECRAAMCQMHPHDLADGFEPYSFARGELTERTSSPTPPVQVAESGREER